MSTPCGAGGGTEGVRRGEYEGGGGAPHLMSSGTGYACSGVDIKNVQYFVPGFIRKLGFVRRRGSTGLCSVTVVARISNASARSGREQSLRGEAVLALNGEAWLSKVETTINM